MMSREEPLKMYKDTEAMHRLEELRGSTEVYDTLDGIFPSLRKFRSDKIIEEVYDALDIIFPYLRKFRNKQDIHLYFVDGYPEENRPEAIWFGEDFGKTEIAFQQVVDSMRYTPFQANLKMFLNCYLKKGVLGLPSFETVMELKMKLKLMGMEYETFSSGNPFALR